MEWREGIVCDPKILVGKPTVRGTRISVELILGWLSAGWSFEQLLDSYPNITRDDVLAALAYARELVRDDGILPLAEAAAWAPSCWRTRTFRCQRCVCCERQALHARVDRPGVETAKHLGNAPARAVFHRPQVKSKEAGAVARHFDAYSVLFDDQSLSVGQVVQPAAGVSLTRRC